MKKICICGRKSDGDLPARDIIAHERTFSRMPWSGMYLGYTHRFGTGTRLNWRYELTERRQEVLAEQDLGGRWYLRWEHDLTNEEDTGAVGCRFRDRLRAEYMVTNTEQWLRLTGRL